ncbi:hypothetical protein [Mycetocola sp. JXN-3]|uniref:hypothetical protein n=1 Tax=Mycetocola sp. JXN-3 TaxID=2116510 RepID=UPI00165CFE01|nr:hypothetical protein [Mycetocola sp. JXN-3]
MRKRRYWAAVLARVLVVLLIVNVIYKLAGANPQPWGVVLWPLWAMALALAGYMAARLLSGKRAVPFRRGRAERP